MSLPLRALRLCGAIAVEGRVALVQRCLAEMDDEDAIEAANLAYIHRVVPQFLRNIRIAAKDATRSHRSVHIISQRLAGPRRIAEIEAETRRSDLRHVAAAATTSKPVLIKGVYFDSFYAPPMAPRMTGDIDCLVTNQDFWVFLAHAIELGYTPDKVRFDHYRRHRGRTDLPSFYGICPTLRESSLERGEFDSIDIHIGSFPGCGEGVVPVHECDLVDIGLYRLPRPGLALAISLAHIARHGFCKMRDINDLYLLLNGGHIGKNDIARIYDLGLGGIWEAVVDLTLGCYPTLCRPERPDREVGTLPLPPTARRFDLGVRKQDRQVIREPGEWQNLVDIDPAPSRLLQLEHLWSVSRKRHTPWRTTTKAAAAGVCLMRFDRPYRTWPDRRIQDLDEAEHLVLKPLVSFSDPVEYGELQIFASANNMSVEWSDLFQFAVLNRGRWDELIIAPGLALAQCRYDGGTDGLTEAKNVARKLLVDPREVAPRREAHWSV